MYGRFSGWSLTAEMQEPKAIAGALAEGQDQASLLPLASSLRPFAVEWSIVGRAELPKGRAQQSHLPLALPFSFSFGRPGSPRCSYP